MIHVPIVLQTPKGHRAAHVLTSALKIRNIKKKKSAWNVVFGHDEEK